MSDRLDELKKLAPALDGLRPDPAARMYFEWMSGALVWSDEWPSLDDCDRVGSPICLRGAFRYRTTVILGKPDETRRRSWELLQGLCPNWPAFLPERSASSPERVKYYEEASAKATADWEALDAKYRRQQADQAASTPANPGDIVFQNSERSV